MQITLTNGTSSIVLCHGADYAGQTGYWIGPLGDHARESEWTVRAKRPIRGAAETPLDHSLKAASYGFQVFMECADQAAAEALADSLDDSLPSGDTYLQVLHSAHLLRTYSPAHIQKLSVTQSGVAVLATFLFKVASAAVTDPDPDPE